MIHRWANRLVQAATGLRAGGLASLVALVGCYGVPKPTTPELSPLPRTSAPLPMVEESLARAALAKELPETPAAHLSLVAAVGPPPAIVEIPKVAAPDVGPHVPEVNKPAAPPPLRPVLAALEAYFQNKPQEAMQHMQALAPKDQELLLRLLPYLAEMDQRGLFIASISQEKAQSFLDTLQAVETDVRPLAPLVLDRLIFCRSIKGYGQYIPHSQPHFRPGEVTRVYAELRNVNDQRLPDGTYGLLLHGQLELCRADGQLIGKPNILESESLSRSPRRDFFLRFFYTIPAHLTPGPYQLRLRITDHHTGRTAESKAAFIVLAGS
jgi:hypothetical protein